MISDFIILLARQRSGTNPLRHVLESHPDIFCFTEVFNFNDKDSPNPLLRESNFFTFLERYAAGDARRILPDEHETIFLNFLEYLRCFSDRRYVVVDVKYNSTHLFTKPFTYNLTRPYLFDLILEHRLRVLNLRRKNYLRYAISLFKARDSGDYTVIRGEKELQDRPIRVELDELLWELEKCSDEDAVVQRAFANYGRYIGIEYTDIFPNGDDAVSDHVLGRVSAWLGISSTFASVPGFQKQSSLPLDETIENYDDVVAALTGTKFEVLLQDEPTYRAHR